MDLNQKTLMEVLRLLEHADSLALGIETNGMRLIARKGQAPLPMEGTTDSLGAAAPAATTVAERQTVREAPSAAPSEPASSDPGPAEARGDIVHAPMSGTFYRAPSPGEAPFCEVGDELAADDTVALIEVMKLFNSIPAGRHGRVEKFFVGDGTAVQAGQPLLSIVVD